jgi:hypothetical protein
MLTMPAEIQELSAISHHFGPLFMRRIIHLSNPSSTPAP